MWDFIFYKTQKQSLEYFKENNIFHKYTHPLFLKEFFFFNSLWNFVKVKKTQPLQNSRQFRFNWNLSPLQLFRNFWNV